MRANSEKIRHSILQSIFENYGVLEVKKVAYEYGVTAQTVYKHINNLEAHKKIQKIKSGRHNSYILLPELTLENTYPLENLSEDECLKRDFHPILKLLPQIANSVFSYVFLEMLNNAIEHSEGKRVYVRAMKNAYAVSCVISDNGIGIFTKVQNTLGLSEKRYAILELAKGKFTSDPDSHTGEGIFFSSKAADEFVILSDHLMFVGKTSKKHVLKTDWIADFPEYDEGGTHVMFSVSINRAVELHEVFAQYYKHPESYGFEKTVVPVSLLEYKDENPLFVSRSQARRLLSRFEKFSTIVLDFAEVHEIGQAFADEIFRVFANAHKNCELQYINANERVRNMILRATAPNA
jgi:anti-sigma regulatory factor (Ser/Thr protein kinase)